MAALFLFLQKLHFASYLTFLLSPGLKSLWSYVVISNLDSLSIFLMIPEISIYTYYVILLMPLEGTQQALVADVLLDMQSEVGSAVNEIPTDDKVIGVEAAEGFKKPEHINKNEGVGYRIICILSISFILSLLARS